MNFKDIRQGYPVYILDKQALSLSEGKVTAVGFPYFPTQTPGPAAPGAQPLGMSVDVTIEAGGKAATYTIPEQLSVTFAGNLVLSTDRAGLAAEVEAMRTAARQALEGMERQKEIVAAADGLLAQLKPEYRERAETEKRFSVLEGAMADVKSLLREMADELKNNRTQNNT